MFETFMKLSGYNINSAHDRLKRIQSLTPNEFRKWQDDQKWKIAIFHYDNNSFYRKEFALPDGVAK